MSKCNPQQWCNWPNRDFARQIDDVYSMGASCDAWRRFLVSDTLRALQKVKGHFGWFSRYEEFDKLLVEFDCSEKRMRHTINGLRAAEFANEDYSFTRMDIYDARSWAKLPLRWFVEVDPRVDPTIQFGIRIPAQIDIARFHLSHRMKKGQKMALITCDDTRFDGRFKGKRWCAERAFPRGTTRQDEWDVLMGEVREKCQKYLMTIVGEVSKYAAK